DDLARSLARRADHARAEDQSHAVPEERLPEGLGYVRSLARQELRGVAEEGDLRAESPQRLRPLAADRAAAEDREVSGPLGELEDGLAREEARLVEPRN